MQASTTPGTAPAAPPGGSGSGFSLALAQAHLYFDEHPEGRPAPARAVVRFELGTGTGAERLAELERIAAWLGVKPDFRNGTWFAQREWAERGEASVLVEAHWTPDKDAAWALQVAAAEQEAQVPV